MVRIRPGTSARWCILAALLLASCASSSTTDDGPAWPTIPDIELRASAVAAHRAATEAASACADREEWLDRTDEAIDAVSLLTEQAQRIGRAWVGSAGSRAVAEAIREVLILQQGCRDGFIDGDSTMASATAGRAAGAYDDLYLALTGEPATIGSDFWYHADQIGHTIEMSRLVRDGDPVDVLVVGSSTAKRGFDPVLMTTTLGRSTMNAAVAGLFPAAVEPWVETAIEVGGHPSTIVIGVSAFQDFLGCNQARVEEARVVRRLQADAFAPLPALAGHAGPVRLVGGPDATYTSVALAEYQAGPGDRGLVPSLDQPDPARVRAHVDRYRSQMRRGRYCAANAGALAETASGLVDRGHRVLVVSLPLSPGMGDLHLDGRAGHDRAITAYRQAALDAGAEWLDLTDLLGGDQFLDLTHATASGRAAITEATIDALS